MAGELIKEAPNVPTEERALQRLRRHVEFGQLEELRGEFPGAPRYLVTVRGLGYKFEP